MSTSHYLPTVNDAFFQPLVGLAARSPHARACPEFSDEDYIRCGVQRVLEATPSGRGFLQEHGPGLATAPSHSNYFATLHSPRRCALLEQVSQTVRVAVHATLEDRLREIPELAT